MKKLFFLILIILLNFTNLNAQWEPCNNGIDGREIWTFIVDGNNTYVGLDGGIFKTTDNGDTWLAKRNGLKTPYGYDVYTLAISENRIFAGTAQDGIYLSTDKGENWIHKSNGLPYLHDGWDYSVWIKAILINGNNIIAGAIESLFLSSDNGDNWTDQNKEFKDSIREIRSFIKNGNYIFAGTHNGIFQSTDYGVSWIAKNNGLDNLDISSLAISGNNIFAGSRYRIFLSTDNGDYWKNIGLKDSIVILTIIFKSNYIIIGGWGGIYLSSDNGNIWLQKNLGLSSHCISALIINGDYIFAASCGSGIFRAKLSDLGITDVKETELKIENVIYPNPAASDFKLKYNASNSKTQISIFDMLGNLVFISYDDSNPGVNEKTIDCSRFSTGYYVVKVQCGEAVQTHPLMILK